jgi:hypothetical protein
VCIEYAELCCMLLLFAGACLSKALADAESELGQHHLTRQRQVEAAQEVWGREVAEAEAAWERRVAGACMHWMVAALQPHRS